MLMGVEISGGDLLTTRKLKNTDATFHLHTDQHNIPNVAQINNKEIKKPQYVERRPKNEGFQEVLIDLVLRDS